MPSRPLRTSGTSAKIRAGLTLPVLSVAIVLRIAIKILSIIADVIDPPGRTRQRNSNPNERK